LTNKSQQLQISTKQSIPLDRLGNKVRVWFTLKTLYLKMEMNNNLKTLAIVGALSSVTTLGAYKLFIEKSSSDAVFSDTPSAFTRMVSNSGAAAGSLTEFTFAAEKATPAVVHIKTKMTRQ
jgi:hypothetical protein